MERSPTLSRPCSNVAFSVRLTRTTPGETAAYLHPPNPPLLLHLLHGSHHLLNYFSDTVFYFLSPAAERQRWQVQDYCFFVTTVSAVSKPLPGWLNCSVAAAPWMGHPSGHCPPSSVTVTLRRGSYPPLLSFHHGGLGPDLQPSVCFAYQLSGLYLTSNLCPQPGPHMGRCQWCLDVMTPLYFYCTFFANILYPVLGFPCGSAGKESICNAGDLGSILGLGRSPGEGKGYPLQYSGLENSMDCMVHGVA